MEVTHAPTGFMLIKKEAIANNGLVKIEFYDYLN